MITFAPNLTGGNTIVLSSDELQISVGKHLIIDGSANPNPVISGDDQFRNPFQIQNPSGS